MEWTPATKQEVSEAIEADWIGVDPALRARLATYLVEPQSASIERFGRMENAYIVARLNEHVVFFDDIEEDFGTAKEAGGLLSEVAACGNIALAIGELKRAGSNDS
jgi:hypothetical protein